MGRPSGSEDIDRGYRGAFLNGGVRKNLGLLDAVVFQDGGDFHSRKGVAPNVEGTEAKSGASENDSIHRRVHSIGKSGVGSIQALAAGFDERGSEEAPKGRLCPTERARAGRAAVAIGDRLR